MLKMQTDRTTKTFKNKLIKNETLAKAFQLEKFENFLTRHPKKVIQSQLP